MTDTTTKDLGIATVLLNKLTEETLPKALEIKARLDRGERLDHWDIECLQGMFKRAEEIKPFVDDHPEYQEIFAHAVHLCKELTDQALANEKQSPLND